MLVGLGQRTTAYELLRQLWDRVNRPKARDLEWSPEQALALKLIREGTSIEDEVEKRASHRWLYIGGPPGSGKSEVVAASAVELAKRGLTVLIICPTGQLVHSYKAKLPKFDGVDGIVCDTMQGALGYKRPGQDSQV